MNGISVAMATYNGEEFINEQLASLASQEYLPSELVVCDDNSTDDTVAVIEAFKKISPFPVLIIKNKKKLGPINNFFKSVSYCKGEWICFCDQDDVWLPSKILLAKLEVEKNPTINLVLQKAYLTDYRLVDAGVIFPPQKRNGVFTSNKLDLFFEWHGFLQTVRAEIFQKFNYKERPVNKYKSFPVQSHDQWTCMVANAIGGIAVLPDICAYYRRHSGTVTGSYVDSPSGRSGIALQLDAALLSWQSEVCRSYSAYMRSQKDRQSLMAFRDNLSQAANDYEKLSRLYHLRGMLHGDDNELGVGGFRTFAQLVTAGAYFRPRRYAIGAKELARDSLRLVIKTWFSNKKLR